MRSQHQFSNVPRADIPRSSFNLSHGLKTTFDVDYLIPIICQDIIPGDTWNLRASFFMRLATPLHPIMDNMYVDTHFFFVPYRTIWDNFEKFHGAQTDPGDSIDFTIPVLDAGETQTTGDLGEYLGLPLNLNTTNSTNVSCLPFRAYRKLWNDWFRDENLQDSMDIDSDNGPDANATTGWSLPPRKRGKRFDYFTSCLTAPQKGTAVSMPLGVAAPIFTDSIDNEEITVGEAIGAGGTTLPTTQTFLDTAGAAGNPVRNSATEDAGTYPDDVNLFADLTNAAASTINDIRLAFQTQRLLERDARAGTRYVEALKAHWGVTSPDHRLQRAEFLGGGTSPMNVTPVANTTAIDSTNDPATVDRFPGQLAGYGTAAGTHGFSKSFVEHGLLIGLVSVRADLTYSQGIDRMWSKSTRYDFFYPVLSQIGEQSVLNKEIWSDGTAADETVFGYQERYAEYRFIPSRLSGLFRVDASGTLASWHLSEDFGSLPALGDSFITANLAVPLDRAIAVPAEPHIIADFFFNIKAARPMPLYGVPGNIDRF